MCSRGSRPTATARSVPRDGSRWIARRASTTSRAPSRKMIGGHNLKAGAESRWNFLDYAQPGYPSGQFTFGRGITCRDRFSCAGNEGNGLAAMLIGWPSGGDFHIDPKVFTRSAYWGFYVHDDWRIEPKLTLNLGLRYDFDVPRWETQDRMSYWDLEAQSPDAGARLRHARRDQVRRRRQSVAVQGGHEQRAAARRLRVRAQSRRRPFAGLMGCSTRSAAPRSSDILVERSTSTPRPRSRSTPTRRATRRSPIPIRTACCCHQAARSATAPSSVWVPAPSCRATTATPSTTPGTCRSSAKSAGARSSRPTTRAAAAPTCSCRSRR